MAALRYLAVRSAMNMQYSERFLLQCYKYFLHCVPVSLMVVHNNSCKNADRRKKSLASWVFNFEK